MAKKKAVLILAGGTVVLPEERVFTLEEIHGSKLSGSVRNLILR